MTTSDAAYYVSHCYGPGKMSVKCYFLLNPSFDRLKTNFPGNHDKLANTSYYRMLSKKRIGWTFILLNSLSLRILV